MLSTRVGYAGGATQHPSYHQLGDHREAVEVTFNPQVISYEELLDVFWRGQPIRLPPDPNPRVHLAVMPSGEWQTQAVADDLIELRRQKRGKVQVDVLPNANFWPAEPLHQKFYLQRGHGELVQELAAGFPDLDSFLTSTAATKLNAWLTPMGHQENLHQAAQELGIQVKTLRDLFEKRDHSAESQSASES